MFSSLVLRRQRSIDHGSHGEVKASATWASSDRVRHRLAAEPFAALRVPGSDPWNDRRVTRHARDAAHDAFVMKAPLPSKGALLTFLVDVSC